MTNEQVYRLFRTGIIGVVLILLATIGSCAHRSALIGEAIKSGADPVLVRCSIEAERSTIMCTQALSTR